MEDRKTILDGMYLDANWHQEIEEATNRVMCLYSKISEKFEKDSKYGKDFVVKNQALIGQLVQAATQEINAYIISQSIEKTNA